jgi:hypothetical protein
MAKTKMAAGWVSSEGSEGESAHSSLFGLEMAL